MGIAANEAEEKKKAEEAIEAEKIRLVNEQKKIDEARLFASFKLAKEPHDVKELRKAVEDLLLASYLEDSNLLEEEDNF